MSVGSALVIQMDGLQPKAYFAGIVLRGGKESFHLLKVGVIRDFLKIAFGKMLAEYFRYSSPSSLCDGGVRRSREGVFATVAISTSLASYQLREDAELRL